MSDPPYTIIPAGVLLYTIRADGTIIPSADAVEGAQDASADASVEAARLCAALLPFARYAARVLDQAAARDDEPLRDADIVLRLDDALITVGDLRRAVAEVRQ